MKQNKTFLIRVGVAGGAESILQIILSNAFENRVFVFLVVTHFCCSQAIFP